jgi:primosomal protein N' (replication factor Y)
LPPDADFAAPELNPAQTFAAKELRDAVRAKKFSVNSARRCYRLRQDGSLFRGGRGDSEAKRQALILLPEIALTTRFLDRFAERFGERPAEWHSAIAPRKRARTWEGVAKGEISVVAGARSALFLPFSDLALIVLDEEHDPAYKQEDGVHYHARDMAVVRGSLAQAAVVLTSATPSIETESNARRGRYKRLQLSERFSGTEVPQLEAIDLKKEGPQKGRWISPRLELRSRRRSRAASRCCCF